MSRGFRGCHRIATTSRKGMASKRYSVFSVNDNPEPVDWQKLMRSIAPTRIHKRWCNVTISSRYQRGNTRGLNTIETEQDRRLVEYKCSTLFDKWNQWRTSWPEP